MKSFMVKLLLGIFNSRALHGKDGYSEMFSAWFK